MKRTLTSDGKYMFTYTNISSDLRLAYDVHTEVGDFYCKDNSGNAYLIPYDVPSFAGDKKTVCLGVVLWAGDITDDDPLLKEKFPDGTHGLVVSLDELPLYAAWSVESEVITRDWLRYQGGIYGITSLKVEDKMQGYSNTQALIGYNNSQNVLNNNALKVLPLEVIATYYDSPTPPASSSGWYFPSVMEVKYVCWGQGNERGTTGRDMLNIQFNKAGGRKFWNNDNYQSSTEDDNNGLNAVTVDFKYGHLYSPGKRNVNYLCPVLAF